MRKIGISGALVEAVMSQYKGTKTKVTFGTHLFDILRQMLEYVMNQTYHYCCSPM